jgi:hypothetical protein
MTDQRITVTNLLTDEVKEYINGREIIKARSQYDKSKKAVVLEWVQLTLEEAKQLPAGGHVQFITRFGTAMNAKVTSVKTWKTRPGDVDTNLKVGMYEYFTASYRDGKPQHEQLVKPVNPD